MFLLPSQGRRSQWPPSKAMSSSATTCPRHPFRAVWMRSRCPSVRSRGMACCFTQGSQLIMSTCLWGTELCGWSSTWALVLSRPWWNLPVGSLTTMSGTTFGWRATSAKYVWLPCLLLTGLWKKVQHIDFIDLASCQLLYQQLAEKDLKSCMSKRNESPSVYSIGTLPVPCKVG